MDYYYEYVNEYYGFNGGEDFNQEEHAPEYRKWYEEIPRSVSEPDFVGDEISYTYDYLEEDRKKKIELLKKLYEEDERLISRKMFVLSLIVKFVGKDTVSE